MRRGGVTSCPGYYLSCARERISIETKVTNSLVFIVRLAGQHTDLFPDAIGWLHTRCMIMTSAILNEVWAKMKKWSIFKRQLVFCLHLPLKACLARLICHSSEVCRLKLNNLIMSSGQYNVLPSRLAMNSRPCTSMISFRCVLVHSRL